MYSGKPHTVLPVLVATLNTKPLNSDLRYSGIWRILTAFGNNHPPSLQLLFSLPLSLQKIVHQISLLVQEITHAKNSSFIRSIFFILHLSACSVAGSWRFNMRIRHSPEIWRTLSSLSTPCRRIRPMAAWYLWGGKKEGKSGRLPEMRNRSSMTELKPRVQAMRIHDPTSPRSSVV